MATRSAAFTAALALVTGAFALLGGLVRLGFVANFVSEPVLKGFIIGFALTIMIGQVPKLFGVEKGTGNFFEQAWDLLGNLGDTQATTLAVGVASLALVMGLRRVAPAVPASLVAVFFGVALVAVADLDSKGVAIVGPIDSGLPGLGLPDGMGLADYLALAGSSLGIMLVGFAEAWGGQDLCDAEPLRDRRQPGAPRARGGQSRVRAVPGDGGQRKPVQDRRERVGRCPHRSSPDWWWRR